MDVSVKGLVFQARCWTLYRYADLFDQVSAFPAGDWSDLGLAFLVKCRSFRSEAGLFGARDPPAALRTVDEKPAAPLGHRGALFYGTIYTRYSLADAARLGPDFLLLLTVGVLSLGILLPLKHSLNMSASIIQDITMITIMSTTRSDLSSFVAASPSIDVPLWTKRDAIARHAIKTINIGHFVDIVSHNGRRLCRMSRCRSVSRRASRVCSLHPFYALVCLYIYVSGNVSHVCRVRDMVALVDDLLLRPVARLLCCILDSAHAYTRGQETDVAAVWAAAECAVRACAGACPCGEPDARGPLCACALVWELGAPLTQRSFGLLHALNSAALARLFGAGVHDFAPPVEYVVARRMHASLLNPAMFGFMHALALALRAFLEGARRGLRSLQQLSERRANADAALLVTCRRALELVLTPAVRRAMNARRRSHCAALRLASGYEVADAPALEDGPAASMNSPRAPTARGRACPVRPQPGAAASFGL